MYYEFKCIKCGKVFEKNLHIEEDKNNILCECGSKTKRIFSSPKINFVGTGFYVNDYKKAGI